MAPPPFVHTITKQLQNPSSTVLAVAPLTSDFPSFPRFNFAVVLDGVVLLLAQYLSPIRAQLGTEPITRLLCIACFRENCSHSSSYCERGLRKWWGSPPPHTPGHRRDAVAKIIRGGKIADALMRTRLTAIRLFVCECMCVHLGWG